LAASVFSGLFAMTPRPAVAQQTSWQELPRMELQQQFGGPLRDTIVQRLRDPYDGTVCYLYLPMVAQHTPPTQSGYVQYGANTIGSISCVPGTAASQRTERLNPVPSPPPER
jgi:hypothetical protein